MCRRPDSRLVGRMEIRVGKEGMNMYLSKYCDDILTEQGERYLIHTLAGSIDRVSDKVYTEYKSLKEDAESSLSEETRDLLTKKKYLMESEEEEKQLIEEAHERYRQKMKKKPITFFNYITFDCNLRCSYCCYRYLDRETPVMETPYIDNVFKAMAKLQKESGHDCSRIVLSGGEPLLKENYEQVAYFFSKAKRHIEAEAAEGRKCIFTIFTNATQAPEFRELLTEYRDMVSLVFVTLNGTKENHDKERITGDGKGSYEQVIAGINTLLELGINTLTVCNVGKKTIAQLPGIYDVACEQGWTGKPNFKGCFVSRIKDHRQENENVITEDELIKTVVKMTEEGKLKQDFYNFGDLKQLKIALQFLKASESEGGAGNYHQFSGCNNKGSQYSFSVDANIYACAPSMGLWEYSIGSFMPDIIYDREMKDWWDGRSFLNVSKCRNCSIAFLCGGGCAFEAVEKNGDSNNPNCSGIKNILKLFLETDAAQRLKHDDLLYD